VTLTRVEQFDGPKTGTIKSAIFSLDGAAAARLADRWHGSMQWICLSPYRAGHRRKNWFFTGKISAFCEAQWDDEVRYESCHASGPGGQHVNKTLSAVRATHLATGISVRVQSERSQHANKRLAQALLSSKLAEREQQQIELDKQSRHKGHYQIERGNAIRVFKGADFVEVTRRRADAE